MPPLPLTKVLLTELPSPLTAVNVVDNIYVQRCLPKYHYKANGRLLFTQVAQSPLSIYPRGWFYSAIRHERSPTLTNDAKKYFPYLFTFDTFLGSRLLSQDPGLLFVHFNTLLLEKIATSCWMFLPCAPFNGLFFSKRTYYCTYYIRFLRLYAHPLSAVDERNFIIPLETFLSKFRVRRGEKSSRQL